LRRKEVQYSEEIKELNFNIANLNREKVNLMRENTLYNDKAVKFEAENKTLRDTNNNYQIEVEQYQ
jgi:hypothetical protein